MDEYKRLLGRSLKLLGRRPRSEKEMQDFLNTKTTNTDLINQIMDWLKHNKFLNDAEFTSWYIESRSRSRPRGLRLLQQELKQKGITSQVSINEQDLALQALDKKKNLKNRDQAIRHLQYRGFNWSAIEVAIKKRYNDGDVNSDF